MGRGHGLHLAIGVLPLAACSTLSTAAVARELVSEESPGRDIIVTARRRAEPIQDIPIALSAFSSGSIEERSSSNLAEITEFAPNVLFDSTAPISGSANAASIFIRGVGQTDFTISSDSGVAVYLDGVNLSRSIGAVVDLFDVKRVEVLRGPQGTLFGRNAVGGAINVVRAKPGFGRFSAEGQLITGSFDRRDVMAVANLVLGPSLAMRIGGVRRRRRGYARRLLVGGTLGGIDNFSLRGAVRWQPRPSTELLLLADYNAANEEPPASALISGSRTTSIGAPQTIFAGLLYNNLITGPDGTAPCQRPDFVAPFCGLPGLIELPPLPAGTPPFDERWLTSNLRQTYATGPSRSDHRIAALTAVARMDVAGIELKSITAYRRLHAWFGRDPDNSPLALIETTNDIRHRQFSQEFQLSGSSKSFTWIAGFYYLRESGSDGVTANFAQETFDRLRVAGLGCTLTPALTGASEPLTLPVCPNIFAVDYLGRGITAYATSFAAFGEASFGVTDKLTLTAGGRWTRDRKRIDISNYTVGGVRVASSPRAALIWNEFTPRFVLDWHADRDKVVYGSWSSGYKAGGFNQRYGAPVPAPTSYKPERVTSLEAGFKSKFLNGNLTLNVALFRTNYNDMQVVVSTMAFLALQMQQRDVLTDLSSKGG